MVKLTKVIKCVGVYPACVLQVPLLASPVRVLGSGFGAL